ncbi:hypothetical protein [Vibrio sp. SCSIO 43137]|uniref:hypothetical protein n=1 Tax=Vibrio sp. SCSIO 43137 TaxID=3021011 RepID=UPI0023077020|nr:hypothetical protein [Vibrio sp. SCSIO 43137]WCE30540.1 hypothetical protein PK654_04495 [Vibrio sp. SCSIO 43137]
MISAAKKVLAYLLSMLMLFSVVMTEAVAIDYSQSPFINLAADNALMDKTQMTECAGHHQDMSADCHTEQVVQHENTGCVSGCNIEMADCCLPTLPLVNLTSCQTEKLQQIYYFLPMPALQLQQCAGYKSLQLRPPILVSLT